MTLVQVFTDKGFHSEIETADEVTKIEVEGKLAYNSETPLNSSFIQDCFKKVFPEYNEFPEGHRLLELQKLLEEGSK